MTAPQPIDYIFLEIDSEYTEELLLDSGLKLFLDPSYKKEQNVTVVGRVVSLPRNPKGEDKEVVKQLSVGDEVCFSYSVVADIAFADESEAYHEITSGSEYFKKWRNSKGEELTKNAMPGIIGNIWVSSYIDCFGNFVAGASGSEHDVDRFLAQFTFGTTDTYKFKRVIEINGKELWMATPSEIYAKKVGDELKSVGTRVLMNPIDYKLTAADKQHFGIILTSDAVIRLVDRAVMVSGGEELGVKKGDVLGFESRFCEKYKFYDKEFYLIKTSRILGTYVA